jgi:hypothetical protein
MLGAPGDDGVFRFEPSAADDTVSNPAEDDESVKNWFDTTPDPELAQAVAHAEAQARAEVPALGAPVVPTPVPTEIPTPVLPTAVEPDPVTARIERARAEHAVPEQGRPVEESATPTPPRGMPLVPPPAPQVHHEPGPARPGYPSPPAE